MRITKNMNTMNNMKKCPPGVICVENVTMFFLFIIIFIVGYFIYINFFKNAQQGESKLNNTSTHINEKIIINERPANNGLGYYNQGLFSSFMRPNYGYTNLPGDVLLNPYTPPLKDERYLVPEISYYPPGAVPINISTNIGAVNTSYRQVGILTPLNGPNKILPLMGRPLFTNRDKWQYYTLSEPNNIKLPVVKNGKSCTNEYGCDNLYNGDTIYVEGYNDAFKVTVYDNDTIRYIPQI
jgi:hypothetical protein